NPRPFGAHFWFNLSSGVLSVDGWPAARPAWGGQCSGVVLIATWLGVQVAVVEALRICAEVTSGQKGGQEVTENSSDMTPSGNTACRGRVSQRSRGLRRGWAPPRIGLERTAGRWKCRSASIPDPPESRGCHWA